MIICPFCKKENTDYDELCGKCEQPLEGESYLKKLVEHHESISNLRESKGWKEILEFAKTKPNVAETDLGGLIAYAADNERMWLKQIKDAMARASYVKIDDFKLRKQLQRIRDIVAKEDDPGWREYIYEEDPDEAIDSIFNWLDPIEIKDRAREIGNVITAYSTPNILDFYVSEIRDCYRYGLFNVSVVLCRTLLEVSLIDALKRRKIYKSRDDDYKLGGLIRKCKDYKVVSKELIDDMYIIKQDASKFLHPTEKLTNFAQADALALVRLTFSIVERLY